MVCLGNICRSPLADGLLRQKIAKRGLSHVVDSAGTSAHHVGEKPDSRMIKTAKQFGLDISSLRARLFEVKDFDEFDLIYVMDKQNLMNVNKLARNQADLDKVSLILDLIDSTIKEVPDPYYGGESGFLEVYSLLDRATEQLLTTLKPI